MDEQDSVDILQQILESKILEWDPHESKIMEITGRTAEDSYEDGVNTDTNIAAISTEIDKRNIVGDGKDGVEKQKLKRGRPKKRVVQCRTGNIQHMTQMDEEDYVNILQEILESKILDWDPHGSKISGSGDQTGEDVCENPANTGTNIAALSTAIEKCNIQGEARDDVKKQKPKRGRPKKRVVQCRNKLGLTHPMGASSHNKQNNNERCIRATSSPVLNGDLVRHATINLESTIYEEEQQGQNGEDEESDTNEIMQQIVASGILDWNPHGSSVAKHTDNNSLDLHQDMRKKSTGIDDGSNTQQKDHSISPKARRRRGRPARRAKTLRKRGKKLVPISPTPPPHELGNNNSRPMIRATSNPVQEHQHIMSYAVNHEDNNENGLCTEEGEVSPCVSANKLHRGRPKKRVVGARGNAFKRQVVHQSNFNAYEVDDSDNEYTQIQSPCSPAPSAGRILDNEYRPSPLPQAAVVSSSSELQAYASAELTEEDIIVRAMAKPVLWLSAWQYTRTLALDKWIDASVANYYLLHAWYQSLNREKIRYVDLYMARTMDITDEEIDVFRGAHFVPHEGVCPMVPVGFIIHDSNHFFAVIFDFHARRAYVLGRSTSSDAIKADRRNTQDWNQWKGPEYWRHIAALHHWDAGEVTDISVTSLEWIQNGVDCGPIACSVLEQFINAGFDENGRMPSFSIPCGHQIRIQMLHVIAGRIKMSCSDYLMLLDSAPDSWTAEIPGEDIINNIQNGRYHAECHELLRRITIVSSTCSQCRRPVPPQNDERTLKSGEDGNGAPPEDQDTLDAEFSDDEDAPGTDLPADRRATLSKLLKANRQLVGSRNRNSIVPRAIGTHIELEPDTSSDHLAGE
ncbi:hypothetical protein BDR04DRAFT_1163563 [Suillus decipiens]|nr:hypothetical protein BDR04DRAFT_1163563 [Suillus decipiens]